MADRTPRANEPALKRVDFLVLAVLADGPKHGYGIVLEMTHRTGGKAHVRPGDLYRVLQRMSRSGLVRRDDRRAADDLEERRRTYYAITEEGERRLRAEAEVLAPIVAALRVTEAERGDAS